MESPSIKCAKCQDTDLTFAYELTRCRHTFCEYCYGKIRENKIKTLHAGTFRPHYLCPECKRFCLTLSVNMLTTSRVQIEERRTNSSTRKEDHRGYGSEHGDKLTSRDQKEERPKNSSTPKEDHRGYRAEHGDKTYETVQKTRTYHDYDPNPGRWLSQGQHDFPTSEHEYDYRSIRGLQNTKMTCAINAVVQVLAQTPGFCSAIFDTAKKNGKLPVLTNILANIIIDINNTTGLINSEALQSVIIERKDEFHFWQQHDCHSFLLCLLGALEEELGHGSMSMFTGQMKNRFKYQECSHTEYSELQDFISLCIPVIDGQSPTFTYTYMIERVKMFFYKLIFHASAKLNSNTVDAGLKMLLQKEELMEDHCRTCGKDRKTCSKELLIEKAPKILVLHIAKFKEVKSRDGRVTLEKRHESVTYKDHLELPTVRASSPVKYRLFAIISHLGTIDGGHYVAYVQKQGASSDLSFSRGAAKREDDDQHLSFSRGAAKRENDDQHTNAWYHCTDSIVSRLGRDAGSPFPISRDAYLLFYCRTS